MRPERIPERNENNAEKQPASQGAKQATHNSLTQAEQHAGKRLGKDRQRGKATYPALLGIETSRRQVQTLIDGACQAIVPLGEMAQPLAKLAHYVGQINR